MEKQQLSVDDDLLPIYYVHSKVEEKTFSRAWQGHEAPVPSTHFNHFPSFNANCLPPGPSRTERTVLNEYDHEGHKEVKSVGFTPGTNVEDCCASSAYSGVQRVSDFHQSPNGTNTRTQVGSTSKTTSAQDVFLASLLQVQLCVMDLQDQIDITETNQKAKEMGLKMNMPMGLNMSSPSTLGPERSQSCIEELVRDPEPPCVDEDQESDDTAYSELEVEDERLFCDNPLFKNSEVTHNVDYNVQNSVTELTSQQESTSMDNIVNEGSQLLKPNAWDGKDFGTGMAVWQPIIREESLEELQIYEEWEEKMFMRCSTRTTRWPVSDNLPSTQEVGDT